MVVIKRRGLNVLVQAQEKSMGGFNRPNAIMMYKEKKTIKKKKGNVKRNIKQKKKWGSVTLEKLPNQSVFGF